LAIEVEDDFLFPFLCVALSTASLCGNTICDGATGIMLFSVLQLAACFFCFFLWRAPSYIQKYGKIRKKIGMWHACPKTKVRRKLSYHACYLSLSSDKGTKPRTVNINRVLNINNVFKKLNTSLTAHFSALIYSISPLFAISSYTITLV
jgi:hypothetical protein